MPLTAKGEKILNAMEETYGNEKKAKSVLYASINAGKITGAHEKRSGDDDEMPADMDAADPGAETDDCMATDAAEAPHYAAGGVGGESFAGKEHIGYSIHASDEPMYRQAGTGTVHDMNSLAAEMWGLNSKPEG